MLKIFNHLKIKYRIKVRVGSEKVQPRTNSRIESQSGSAQSSIEQGSRAGSTVTRSRNIESRESQNHNVEILTREMVLDSIKKSFGVFPDAGNNDQKDQRAQTSHSSIRNTQNKVLVNLGTKM